MTTLNCKLSFTANVQVCACAGRALEDGSGVLPDGTQWDRQSGEEFGPNGYWFRWHRLRGKSGKVCHAFAAYKMYSGIIATVKCKHA